MDKHVGKLSYIIIDCNEPAVSAEFWCKLLGLHIEKQFGPYTELGGLDKSSPKISLQQVPDQKTTKNRIHLDITVTDLNVAQRQIESLGGSLQQIHSEDRWEWRTMADPDGNEFCIIV